MKKWLLTAMALCSTAAVSFADVYTLEFNGADDLYGLTRYATKPAQTLHEVTIDGAIDLKLVDLNTSASSFGFYLAGKEGYTPTGTANNQGLCVAGSFTTTNSSKPELTLNGGSNKIKKVILTMSGTSIPSTNLTFTPAGGSASTVKPTDTANGAKVNNTYQYTNTDGTESVVITWALSYYSFYIHSIDIEYEADLGGLTPAGISFSKDSAAGTMGEPFTPPTFNNPNGLDITWTSSNPEIATVDQEGNVEIVGGGTVYIYAKAEDQTVNGVDYKGAEVRYQLTATAVGNSLAAMAKWAPKLGNSILVTCPLTVTYASGLTVFVVDPEGNAGQIDDQTNAGVTGSSARYAPGDIIPAGWTATNSNRYTLIWQGKPAKATEQTVVVYPEMTSMTPQDNNKVITLQHLTFSQYTPDGTGKVNAVTENGTVYQVQNPYGLPSLPPATYDVTGVVQYMVVGSTTYFYLAAIEYTALPLEFPNPLRVTADVPTVTFEMTEDEEGIPLLKVGGVSVKENLTLNFDLAGWTGVIAAKFNSPGGLVMQAKTTNWENITKDWPTLEEYKEQMSQMGSDIQEGTSLTFALTPAAYMATLYSQDKVSLEAVFFIQIETIKLDLPESLNISAEGQRGVKIAQEPAGKGIKVDVTGVSSENPFTLKIEAPEGFTEFMGAEATSTFNPTDKGWITVESFRSDITSNEANTPIRGTEFKFPADGTAHTYKLFPVSGTQVNTSACIEITVNVEEGIYVPEFPESLVITAVDQKYVTIQQDYDADEGRLYVELGGKSSTEEFTLSIQVPEGFDGYIGFAPNYGGMRAARAAAPEGWPTIEEYKAMMSEEYPDMVEGSEFTIKCGGSGLILCPTMDGAVDVTHGIMITATVEHDNTVGIAAVEAENAGVRYFNLQGAEVANPTKGIYVKVADGKATKVVIK